MASEPISEPPAVTLVVGGEELLMDRAVAEVVASCRALDPDVDVRRLEPEALAEPGALAGLTSPSLFGERTVLVVERAHDLSGESATSLARYIESPAEQVILLVLHSGAANRAKAVLEACRSTKAVRVECPKVSRQSERLDFVRAEARSAGRPVSEDAARSLVDAVGTDLRELAAACAQLVADTDGPLTSELVRRYYAGRAEVTSFQVADSAMEGRTAEALERLRFALDSGVAPVLVTSALAQGLRAIARVGSASRGATAGDLARELGMPPWKVDAARRQLRGWTGDGVSRALTAVARADASVKGLYGSVSPGYALERALVAIAVARDPGVVGSG